MSEQSRTGVGIVEDQPIFQLGLLYAIGSTPDLEVIALARSVEEFGELRPPRHLTVVILGACCADGRGSAAVATMSACGYAVLVVAESEHRADVVAAIAAGACGYLSKRVDAAEVLTAVRAIAQGQTYVSACLDPGPVDVRASITLREAEVLRLVADGRTDREVAAALGISVRTVHSHLDRIREKTGRRRRSELTRLALEHDIGAVRSRGISTPPRSAGLGALLPPAGVRGSPA